MGKPSAIEIFGTDEPVPEQRLLSAGPLTAILEDGNLRYIRFDGIEIVRAVNYLARDAGWGTWRAELSDLVVTEEKDRFAVSYEGRCGSDANRLAYRMTIEGAADGRLTMQADAVALTDFETNRTGFVILLSSGAAGGRMSVTHTDGSIEDTVFPLRVMADQPAFDIAALTHEPAPGLTCTFRMNGDAFEMEDQRNWTDASFKTYVRPLSKPRPYVIAKGAHDRQGIEIEVGGTARTQDAASRPKAPVAGRHMPSIALFTEETVPASGYEIPRASANRIILRLDAKGDPAAFFHAAEAATSAGIEPSVEIVFDALDAAAEARHLLALIAYAGLRPAAVLATCRRDFKTRPSGTLPHGEASVSELIAALRDAGFSGRIGAGTPSNFTEFNRNPPPPDCDFIYFAIAAIVHAADDISVVETLEAYPAVIESARALCPGKPLWLGPCTIAPRHNPYGAALVLNPEGGRVPAAGFDPRQSTLFGAAFAIGIAAAAGTAGVETLSLAALAGTFGLTDANGQPNPIAAVHGVLSLAAGSDRLDIPDMHPHCRGIAWVQDGREHVLIANLSASEASVDLRKYSRISILDLHGWTETDAKRSDDFRVGPYRSILVARA